MKLSFFFFHIYFVVFACLCVCFITEAIWRCWKFQIIHFFFDSFFSFGIGRNIRITKCEIISLSISSRSTTRHIKIHKKQLTFKSLKKIVFLAQSTCVNKFWSKTLHINSNRSTSHWLYVWLCKSENKDCCHSRSSTVCTNSRIIGDTLIKMRLISTQTFSQIYDD